MLKSNKLILLLMINVFFFNLSNAQLFGNKEELVKMKTFQSFENIQKGGELKIAFELDIAKKWHINSNTPNEDFLIKSEIVFSKNSQFEIVNIVYPEAKDLKFSFSDKPVSVYEGTEYIGVILKATEDIEQGEYILPVEFVYQACNDVTCMAPVGIKDTIKIKVVNNQTPINEINSEIFTKLNLNYTITEIADEEDGLAKTLESSGLLLSLLIVFIGGLALNLTPCVYPLIPITIGFFGSQSEGSTGRLAFLGSLYVLGMALTYSTIGVITSLSGAVFGALLQNPLVIIFVAGIIIALALSMFGVYEFKLPNAWVMKAGNSKSGAIGSLIMGLTMGVVAAPCIGPFVLGLVTYVAAKGDVVYGFLMFFVMAVGLGTPYLFLAIFSGKIKSLPRAGMWMIGVERIFGFILVGMAIYFILPLLPKELSGYILPGYGIIVSLYMLFFHKMANNVIGYRIFKTIFAIIIIGISTWVLIPSEKKSPNWEYYSNQKFETALQNNEKIVIDFYADWCIPCKELDALTFSDPKVISKMSEFISFKVDMTKSMSDITEQIRTKFNIVGMPTLLIYDTSGKEIKRLTGFINASEFLEILNLIQ